MARPDCSAELAVATCQQLLAQMWLYYRARQSSTAGAHLVARKPLARMLTDQIVDTYHRAAARRRRRQQQQKQQLQHHRQQQWPA